MVFHPYHIFLYILVCISEGNCGLEFQGSSTLKLNFKSQSRSNSGGIINGIENTNKKPDLEMENPDEGFPSISGKCRSSNLSEIGKQKIICTILSS